MQPQPASRSAYRHFQSIPTRWMDNDPYGHVNNVVYYSWFDTAVNQYLINGGALDIALSPVIGLVVESHCNYFQPIAFPEPVVAGVRVTRLGKTSVRYEIGLFCGANETAAAQGHFVHVYVERQSRRPAPVPEGLRSLLAPLVVTQ